MKLFYILTLLFLSSICVSAQDNKGFFSKRFIRPEIKIGHTFEGLVGNTVLFPEDEYSLDYNDLEKSSTMYSFRIVGGGYIHPHISLGLGVGIEGNSGYLRTASPFFIDARFYADNMYNNTRGSFFLYGNYGILHKWNQDFEKGIMIEAGIGFEAGRSALSVGYNYRRLKEWRGYLNVHSVTASYSYAF